MKSGANQRTCLITGSRGYLGGCVRARFQREGWKVVELTRNPDAEEMREGRAVPFRLGGEISAEQLTGADALVHCAHDFTLYHWEEIHAVNVLGTEKLFAAAREAGVSRRLFVSSMSAFEGCRSMYGRAKLEIEKRLQSAEVFSARPGMIYGDQARGIFGNLASHTGKTIVLPLFGGGRQFLYLTHQDDLCQVILDYASGHIPGCLEPVTTAYDQGWTFRSHPGRTCENPGKRPRFIPVPWRLAWLIMRGGEICHLPSKFRSDSLISLMNQNLNPSFELTRRLGLKFRPFQPEMLKL